MPKTLILLLAAGASLQALAAQRLFINEVPLPQSNSEPANHYAKLKSAKSLIIYDCAHGDTIDWCKSPAFSFDNILRIAGGVAQPSLDVEAVKKKIVSTGRDNHVWPTGVFSSGTIDSSQITPLAIVNRMDLADWNEASAKWSDAELRFVYGFNKNFTLSVEFVLPATSWPDFQNQALAWENLSSSSNFLADLTCKVLKATNYEHSALVRIGVNVSQEPGNSDVSWMMSQWTIDQTGLRSNSLLRQIDDLTSPQYKGLWSSSVNWIPSGATPETVTSISIPESMQPLIAKFNFSPSVGLSTIGPSNPSPRVRNILGLQQCTLCHSSETGTKFQHIANQTSSQQVELSKFLTGNTTNLDPSLDQLTGVILKVPVQYFDAPGHTTTVTRSFHDLARRKLFLSYLLAAQGSADIASIRQYHVDFVH